MIVGIDIGTSYSSIAIRGVDGKAEPVIVANGAYAFGDRYILPSAVFADDAENLVIGQLAMTSRIKNPSSFKSEFKRDLGQNEPIILGNFRLLPEDMYREFFLYFIQCAEKASGKKISQAYISYPANYSQKKRELIKAAANKAGLLNIELIDEPTAAAYCYYAKGKIKEGDILLVYDFGGGTFDVALIQYKDRGFHQLTPALGLDRCGGTDINRLIFEDIFKSIPSTAMEIINGNDVYLKRLNAQIMEASVRIKHELSIRSTVKEVITIGLEAIEYEISQEKLNQMIDPLVEETLVQVRQILKNANMSNLEINSVLIVGGSSHIPYVQEKIKTATGQPVNYDVDPELAVCTGAALWAPHQSFSGNNDYFTKAVSLMKQEKYDAAIKEFDIIIANDRYAINAFIGKSLAYISKRDNEQAKNVINEIYRNMPDNSQVKLYKAFIDECNDGDFSNIDNLLDENNRNTAVALMVMAKKARFDDKPEYSKILYEQAEKMGIYDDLLYYGLDITDVLLFIKGIQALESGTYQEAIDLLGQAAAHAHDFADAHFYYALALKRAGLTPEEKDKIKKHCNLAVELAPEAYPAAYLLLGQYELQDENISKALGYLNKALELQEDYSEGYYLRAQAFTMIGDIDRAIDDIKKLITIDSELKAEGYFALATLYMRKDRYDEALQYFDKAADLGEDQSVIWAKKGELYFLANKYHEAINSLNTAISMGNDDSYTYYILALSYCLTNNLDQAYKYINVAHHLDPANTTILQAKNDITKKLNESKKSCYLTTACCEILGKDDDCEELETLRKFRNEVLLQTPEGQKIIELYYLESPEVAQSLSCHPDRKRIADKIHQDYLVSLLTDIKKQRYPTAIAKYWEMFSYTKSALSNN